MCKWVKSGANRIDPCMRPFIELLQLGGAKTLSCCCGHGRYSTTVVFEYEGQALAVAYRAKFPSVAVILHRKKRFYKRDSDGVYFIPEVDNEKVTLEVTPIQAKIIQTFSGCNRCSEGEL